MKDLKTIHDPPHQGAFETGVQIATMLALLIIVSICFWVPLIIESLLAGDYALLVAAFGIELCIVLLLVAGQRNRGWRG